MSADLVWKLVNQSHSKLKKQKSIGVTFSAEKGNVANINTRAFSGYSPEAVDVTVFRNRVVVSVADKDSINKPATRFNRTSLKPEAQLSSKAAIAATLAAGVNPVVARMAAARADRLSRHGVHKVKRSKK
ncbi:ribosomal protein L28e [Thecamonas trahens ATCC 50062]|uniref:Ribosomal protein L28e n=1 Tax=Thecamonas trahens ATCC 50062 TaxID=461836 RepID=A0A0L0D130_THETB|nr:ribosomal protein L28e [Thecamonas trahens ATCC 50062]KNC45952.1 ribosomal protein L28e [Thecamonas trahens ATCC 50062]|eukprot:XP_013762933.1 ribosomal protein L28e [Thecamonas trahens ATCC 50062]